MKKRNDGFSLIELLVSVLVTSLLLAAATGLFLSQSKAHAREDQSVGLEENLRVALEMMSQSVRDAGYGTPGGSMASWYPWVTLTGNPMITQGSGQNPDSVSVAGCFDGPIAVLADDAALGATTLTVTSDGALTDVLDADARRLVMIDMNEYAHVESLTSGAIAIDTDATTAGTQGLSRAYPDGTPICRVDVITYSIVTDGTTGIPRLERDRNQGDGPETIAEGISNLQLTTPASRRVRIVLTGRSEHRNPVSGAFLTRSLDTDLALRN